MKEQVHLINRKEITINTGNYIGTLKGMEGEGFQCVVDWLEEEELLPSFQDFIIDRDSLVQCTLNNDCRLQHVRVRHDPGHTKNNMTKDLQRVLGQSKAVAGYANQISHWIMTSIKQALLTPERVHHQHQHDDTHFANLNKGKGWAYSGGT
jgi:hypothetical protein